MKTVALGPFQVTPICLGTMTFGEQVDEAASFAILDRAIERGVNFLDTAEMYPVPPGAQTYGRTEEIIGRWLAARPGMRSRVVLASKVAGPARGMPWVRGGSHDVTPEGMVQACDASLKRLRIDTIGKVRTIGLSNETPWGLAEFVRVAEQHGLPRVVSVQNPYCLTNRIVDNGLDEVLHRTGVGLLAYSPLAFGALTGKYDERGTDDPSNPGRIARFERFRTQRWGRPEALAAARRYNALAREHGLTPARMALAFCYGNWRVASTIIGCTSLAQLDECLDAWGIVLAPELLAAIDGIRWEARDPAQ